MRRSSDAKMIAAFEEGWDYHDLVMQRLGCTRRQAKAVNFGIIFGMGVATLAAELGVETDEFPRVPATRASDDGARNEPVAAETVQNGTLGKTDAGGERRIGVERVVIAR